ncbi:MAG: SDR family NAD(P)-dependent oxidoreductase [Alphaproteobacteria bacterium]|nr:SDR family NAD(P)-dependent oxidoreductase [Alphaproteobacteria bacterium]MBU2084391.1 SDR family NAD(P)-dependent oxidoreductase [Alphaproteobacteria bacterium]MBU2142399.1 SDR family NAD(P)-dependent oxidoreductase [Alphaproteobacteria bacterium]MBU2196872.1 SDR family NAD(P)-dependent oxidoreductase [Alphaproteobacteria bacterium]
MAAQDQQPIGSGFGAKSTASEVLAGIDLTGRNAIVTGGYSGLGLETVRALAGAGARVTVPARRVEVAEAALADVTGDIEIAAMDLADLQTVEKFTREYDETKRGLDILINNAGIMACPEGRVGPGWERQFGTNHLGHMAMSLALAPSMQRADSARVVCLSSTGHVRSDVHWDDPHFNNTPYDKWDAYGQAKSANALFALGVDHRGRDVGVRAFSVHPGGIFTPLQRHLSDEEMVALGWKAPDGSIPPQIKAMFKTPEQGASTSVWAATSPQLEGRGGVYCEDCDIAKLADENSQRWEHARPWICDDEKAERLWSMSEKMLADA